MEKQQSNNITSKIEKLEIPDDLMYKTRSSVILAGAMLGKYHEATFILVKKYNISNSTSRLRNTTYALDIYSSNSYKRKRRKRNR